MSLMLGGVSTPVLPDKDAVTVTSCVAYTIGSTTSQTKNKEEEAGGGADCHSQSHGHWIVDNTTYMMYMCLNPNTLQQYFK